MQTSTRSVRSNTASTAGREPARNQRSLAEIGPSIRAGAVASRLGTSVVMVEQLRLSNRILALHHDHGYIYPCWQFEGRGLLSGLVPVLGALAAYSAWDQLAFLVTPHPHLANQRPLDALLHGETEAVLAAARRTTVD